MSKTGSIKTFITLITWGFLAIYSYFAYHLLLTPLLLEFSLIGVAIGWGALLALFFLLPKKERKPVAVFIALFLFLTKALHESGYVVFWLKLFYFLVIGFAVYLVARFYGKLSKPVVCVMLLFGFLLHVVVPKDQVRLLSHFIPVWESPALYTGKTIDYFPLLLRDIDGDGREEIITFGHHEEWGELVKEKFFTGIDPDARPYDLEEEPIFLYVFKWQDGRMVRLANEEVDIEALRPFIPKDYVGFPYYVWDERFTLVPQTQRQNLSEQMGQFGTAPFYAMRLNVHTLAQYMDVFQGIYDRQDQFRLDTPIRSIAIENGELVLETENKTVRQPTRATKIIDLIRTEEGLGLLLMSDALELWQMDDQFNLKLTHQLGESEIQSIMASEFIIADINGDGLDEVLISTSTIRVTISRILRPLAGGEWEILFTSPDTSLRFEAFDTLGDETEQEIIALAKSQVRNHPLRYLTGFTYTEEGLKQNWKTFVSFINVRTGDLDGDGEKELVASIYDTHKVYVLKKHNVPVYTLLAVIFGLLTIYTVARRVRSRHV